MAESISRITFFDNGDLRYHAQVQPLRNPEGTFAFTITSQKRLSRTPHEELLRFLACLSRGEMLNLASVIQSAAGSTEDQEVLHGQH